MMQDGLLRRRVFHKMVLQERESSNSLFETLEDWNTYLKQEDIDLSDLSPKPGKRRVRGPSP